MRVNRREVVSGIGSAVFAFAGAKAVAEDHKPNTLQLTESALARARANLDGEGMLAALEDLVALEKQFGRALTHPIDFEIVAGLIKGQPDLALRLLRLEPIQYRGAVGGPFRQTIKLRDGLVETVEIDFEVDDQAIAYLRSSKPFSVRMSVYEFGENAEQNLMQTSEDFPLCIWQPKTSGKHLIRIQPANATPLDIELITN